MPHSLRRFAIGAGALPHAIGFKTDKQADYNLLLTLKFVGSERSHHLIDMVLL